MKTFTSKTQQIGELGEEKVAQYLESRGFRVVERNYTRKWGELDIVAEKGSVLHFIEVKTITLKDNISRENTFRPEDNMHVWKARRLRRALETYIMDREVDEDQEWQFDLACVYLRGDKVEKIEVLEDLVI